MRSLEVDSNIQQAVVYNESICMLSLADSIDISNIKSLKFVFENWSYIAGEFKKDYEIKAIDLGLKNFKAIKKVRAEIEYKAVIPPINGTLPPTQTTPNCTDGIKNGGETGIDCGGSCKSCGSGGPSGPSGPGCTAKTCTELGFECDYQTDNCGNNIDCGFCFSGSACSNGVCIDLDDGPCLMLNQPNYIYNLETSPWCIRIMAENITLDCQGNDIGNDKSFDGIYSNHNYSTINNCGIYSSENGLVLDNSNYNNLIKINSSYNGKGILISESSNNRLTGISISHNLLDGIEISMLSKNNTLTQFTINNNSYGIVVSSSSDNVLDEIISRDNLYGISIQNSRNVIRNSVFCSNEWKNVSCSSDQAVFSDNTCEGSCGSMPCAYACSGVSISNVNPFAKIFELVKKIFGL